MYLKHQDNDSSGEKSKFISNIIEFENDIVFI